MGKIKIIIEEYRKAHSVSKYSIIKNCDVSATQLNKYLNNQVTRIDLPVVARICDYLKCDITDILEYIPDESEL